MAFTSQVMNSFGQTPILGQVDMVPTPSVISAQINPASVGVFQVGSPVKIFSGVSGAFLVDAATGPTDTVAPLGVIPVSERGNLYTAGAFVEVATNESYVYMLSSAAIVAGTSLAISAATGTTDPLVTTDATSGHQCIGYAMEAAAAAGVLIRVRIAPFTHP